MYYRGSEGEGWAGRVAGRLRSPDVDFEENEDKCESGSEGNLDWVIIAVTSNRKVADLV